MLSDLVGPLIDVVVVEIVVIVTSRVVVVIVAATAGKAAGTIASTVGCMWVVIYVCMTGCVVSVFDRSYGSV